jgi:hypothetical protein
MINEREKKKKKKYLSICNVNGVCDDGLKDP